MLSICGLECDKCKFFGSKCGGCVQVQGRPFWLKSYKLDICSIYDCSINTKGLKDCGKCKNLPCELYDQLKDPRMSEEEHLSELGIRVERLMTKKS